MMKRISDVIAQQRYRGTGRSGFRFDDLVRLHQVRQAWPHVVGAGLAQHSWVSRLDRRELVVVCEDSVWMAEINMMRQEIIDKLAGATSHRFTTLKVQHGMLAAASADQPDRRASAEPVTPSAKGPAVGSARLDVGRVQRQVRFVPQWLADSLKKIADSDPKA